MIAPLTLLSVWFISNYPRKWAAIAASILFIISISGSLVQINSDATPVKEDYQAVSRDITAQATEQDIVALSAPFTIYPFEYYYNGSAALTTLPIWDRVSSGSIPSFDEKRLPEEVAMLNRDHRNIYLILSQDQGYEKQIKEYYLNNFKEISRKQYSPDLILYVFQVGYKTTSKI